MPDILDSKKEGRNKYIEVLHTVAEKFKRNAYRLVVYKVSGVFHSGTDTMVTYKLVCGFFFAIS